MGSKGTRDERGVSELVGVVLLFGLVAIASLVVILSGTPGIETVQSQTDEKQAETLLQEFDSRVSSLTASNDTSQAQFDLGESNPSQLSMSGTGWMNVTVDRSGACATNLTMSSVNYDDDNVQVGYQAGGVWNRFDGGNSTMVSEPAVYYRDGSIDIEIANLSGTLDKTNNDLTVTDSSVPSDALTQRDCIRPENVTIAVQSRYYQAWGRYLETEFESSVTTHDSNQTAVLFLSQSDLPERVNDDLNNVVDLTDSNLEDTNNDGRPDRVTFDKGAGNRYSVSATSLGDGAPDIGSVTSIDDSTNVSRPPLDVMFVIDESSSMTIDDTLDTTRSVAAQTAAERFAGQLNESRDRAGVVTYAEYPQYRLTNTGEYISGDFGPNGVNTSIQHSPLGGGTHINKGLGHANALLELQSNETRDRAIVLLTDGVNDGCGPNSGNDVTNDDDPYDCYVNRQSMDRANDSAANGVTVYTVGYGDDDDIDEALLREIADQTNGSYYQATSAAELNSVFDDIREEIAETQIIAHAPLSSNYTVGNAQVYGPQTVGPSGDIAQTTVNGEPFTNINDPAAESEVSHSFAASDGEPVDFSVHDFECADDGWAGTGQYRTHGGTDYQVVRCAEIADTSDTIQPTGIYLDGDNIAPLLTDGGAWWQEDINASFADRTEISVCRSRDDTCDTFGKISLQSNQALVYYDLPDGGESNNRLLMLYEFGIAESNAQNADVLNIQQTNITAES